MTATNSHGDGRGLAIGLGWIVGSAFVFHAAATMANLAPGSTFDASVSDSLRAFAIVWSDVSNPGSAWTTPAPAHFNVVVFWLCQFLCFGLLGTVAYFAWTRLDRRQASRSALGVKKHAGVAKEGDLRSLNLGAAQPGRLTLGFIGRRNLIATEAQASLAVVGPTGCGKTAGFVIPAILEWSGPVIATSVKADLIAATLAHRQRRGKVWIYDPTACAGETPSSWSPLASCVEWRGAQQMAAWMCEAAQPRIDTISDGNYWYTQAQKILAPYLYAAASTERTMSDVVAWIDTQECDQVEFALRLAAGIEDEIDQVIGSPEGERLGRKVRSRLRPRIVASMREWFAQTGGDMAQYAEQPADEWPTVFQAQLDERLELDTPVALRREIELTLMELPVKRERVAPLLSARATWDKDQRLRDSVFATVENVLAPYADPAVGDVGVECDIDFSEWLSGDNTIFVVATSHEQARLRPVLTTLVQQGVRAAFDAAMRNGGTLSDPCLVLLDEAGNTAPLKDLPAYASTARSHGISLVTVWQDLAQVKAIYRDRAQTVINNHRAKLFGTGIADDHTLEYVSRLIGDVASTEQNYSRDLTGDRRSVSEHTTYRRAAPIDVLRRIRVNEAVLVYGSELPAHIRLRPWFSDSGLLALANDSTTKETR